VLTPISFMMPILSDKLLSISTTSEKMAIYNTEKAKGTSEADIMDMILAYNDAEPEEYKKMTGWGH
jgi:hypothetical protein